MKTNPHPIEPHEARIAPANLLVTVVGHTLNITGDSAANNLIIQGDADPTVFHLASPTDTINGVAVPVATPIGITSISIKMLGGDDTVTFGNTVHIDLAGSHTINGGDGANTVATTDLKVEKNFSITNGTNTAGNDANHLTNLFVGGSLTIKNGDGDTSTTLDRNAAATATDFSSILGSLSITNGSGKDDNLIKDMNVGKNVTISNGHADVGAVAGRTQIFNSKNVSSRSVIGGNVAVSYTDGHGSTTDGIWDTKILGNVTFNHGTGAFTTNFDGLATSAPVVIRGNLIVKGTGAHTINVGTTNLKTGLDVGKSLTIATGSGVDTVISNKLEVGGATKLTLGNGDSTVNIDDSTFAGTFALTGGADFDTVNLETTAGSSSATNFEKPVSLQLGVGGNGYSLAAFDDANQALIIDSSFVFNLPTNSHASGNDAQVFFPFGGTIVFTN